MHPAVEHCVLLLFTAAFSAVGWFIAHDSSKAYRFFTFGLRTAPEQGFILDFSGWWAGAPPYSWERVLSHIAT